MVNFFLRKMRVIFVCVVKFLCYWMLVFFNMCCRSRVNTFVCLCEPRLHLYIFRHISTVCWWKRVGTKKQSVRREEWLREYEVDCCNEVFSLIYIWQAVSVFAHSRGDVGSIPGRVIPKTQKMVVDAFLLNTQHYKVLIKGKVEQSRKGVALSPTPWCSSYWKGSFQVTLDYGRLLYYI